MKNIFKSFMSTVILFTILVTSSFSAFASTDGLLLKEFDFIEFNDVTFADINLDESDQEINLLAPANPVTSITPLDYYVKNGRFIVRVLVMGDGTYRATINGSTAKYLGWYDTIGYAPVLGWYEEFDCGPATIGNHRFEITATSVVFPYASKSAVATFTYDGN